MHVRDDVEHDEPARPGERRRDRIRRDPLAFTAVLFVPTLSDYLGLPARASPPAGHDRVATS